MFAGYALAGAPDLVRGPERQPDEAPPKAGA